MSFLLLRETGPSETRDYGSKGLDLVFIIFITLELFFLSAALDCTFDRAADSELLFRNSVRRTDFLFFLLAFLLFCVEKDCFVDKKLDVPVACISLTGCLRSPFD